MSMNKALDQLRRERAAQYKQLKESEKPHILPCPDCGEAPYKLQVCPNTGIFHERHSHRIVGGSIINSRIVKSSELMAAIDSARIKWSESRTKLVRADAAALNLFQTFVRQRNWELQRYGILYGTYNSEEARIDIHAVYEPEQHGDAYTFHIQNDPREKRVNKIAELLGFRRVGVICTHPPRNIEEMVLSAHEMLLCTREQSRFGDECVLLTMSPNINSERVECQAWQTSQQAVHFFRLGVLQEKKETNNNNNNNNNNKDEGKDDTANDKFVYSTIPLEVAQQDIDEKGHPRVVAKAPSHEIDTRWFTSYVAVQQFESPVVRNLFMRISRPGMEPPTMMNLRNYLQDPKRINVKMLEKLADFHVLIFLADSIFTDVDMEIIIGAITKQRPAEDAMHYEEIVRACIDA